MATQTFEKADFRFVAGNEYTYNGQRGREWVAHRRGDGCWIRAAATHVPIRATRDEIVDKFVNIGLLD